MQRWVWGLQAENGSCPKNTVLRGSVGGSGTLRSSCTFHQECQAGEQLLKKDTGIIGDLPSPCLLTFLSSWDSGVIGRGAIVAERTLSHSLTRCTWLSKFIVMLWAFILLMQHPKSQQLAQTVTCRKLI